VKTSKSVMARRQVVGAETYLSRSVRIERGDLGGGGCSTIWLSSAYRGGRLFFRAIKHHAKVRLFE